MRRIAAIAVLLAVPAQAQIAPTSPPPSAHVPGVLDRAPSPSGPTVGQDIRDVRDDIHRDRSRGALTRREARAQRYNVDRLGSLAQRTGSGSGYSDTERREFDGRVQALRSMANAPVRQGNR